MPCTSPSAVASSARSSLSRPLPASAARNAWISADDDAQRGPVVPDDLAEEEVQRLDGRGALVQRVDLGVADVLLDRVVLQVARAAEGLQRLHQLLAGPLRPHALDDRQQQVVDALGRRDVGDIGAEADPVLPRRRVRVDGAQALGVGLLQHQAAADVGVVDDRDARRGLVEHLREVGALHPLLGVLQRVEVARGRGADGLRADHHAGVLDHLEHLGDAVVLLAEQVSDGGHAVLAERELAGGGDLQPHLVLEVGDEHAVALARLAGRPGRSGTWARGTGRGPWCRASPPSGRASTRCMMFSVTSWSAEVMNRFTPSRCHDAVFLADGLRAARADVGARIGLGEHHRGAPAPLDHELGPALLLGGAVAVHDGGEARGRTCT